MLHLQLAVEHDDAVGAVSGDGIVDVFRLFHQIGQAHGDLRLALINGYSLFPAGVIAAGAAVQLLAGLEFAHLPQNIPDLGFAGHHGFLFDGLKALAQLPAFRLLDLKILVAGIPGHCQIVLQRAVTVLLHHRAPGTAAHAGAHFDEAVVDFALLDLL